MAPNGEAMDTCGRRKSISGGSMAKPPAPKLSKESLHRTLSDISFELNRETAFDNADANANANPKSLPTISEVENAKCECCGMSEECTVEYIERVRDKFMGKWICGLCSEAVKEEMAKKKNENPDAKKKLESAMNAHMSACVRFNKLGRVYPALFQAEAMREMLRKRAKSIGPKCPRQGIARSSSCIPAITRDINNLSFTD
ncbi:PREDICTED: uncharacterized protein LOC104813549 [Tarenaya hassleriana]|uniref:uncharacterized protein LOC104813549 n=1 Tax=Tarenaya hassleriana TaxID=28532 RepID=UPI00053C4160|nr:PREDICTED: uncharacterized protein LOC104813549 [Tarenaya hassleriana]